MLRNIEAERIRKGIPKEVLIKELGISTKTYYNWINECTDVPGKALMTMSKMFGVDVEYLMEGMSGIQSDSAV